METLFISLLVFLVLFAIFDLFVGVSNDAVNFLNSAVGCRIAHIRTTMIVAGLGVLFGATFSSGMMEIARSGIFNPEMFTFREIMIIFFAVMAADILLLNTFNKLGLPTSTTVSIVFDLFGAALACAAVKLYGEGASLNEVFQYINSSKTLTVISGILISVVVAFVCGVLVQYPVRLLFCFNYEKMYRRIGGIFGSLCITTIFYFLVMKGAKGASFMRPEWLLWIKANTGIILTLLFIGFAVLFQLFIRCTKINIFKIVILAGTFSLAFAFAGNDLVNFIGVPLAALDSWKTWLASGVSPDALMMSSLKGPAPASTLILLGSGLIMFVTLWTSKKAKKVIQTSIKLCSAKSDEEENFGASIPGRIIVRSGLKAGSILNHLVPASMRRKLDSRFEPKVLAKGEEKLPFDSVRASVNLMISAILIASATSLQLPLSTTYVTFMVAMGSSFADKAWDRETAVYRITGVLTVICGWFLTAISASLIAASLVLVIYGVGTWSCYLIGTAVLFLIIKSNFAKEPEKPQAPVRESFARFNDLGAPMLPGAQLKELASLYKDIAENFIGDKEASLRALKKRAKKFHKKMAQDRASSCRVEAIECMKDAGARERLHSWYRACTALTLASQSVQVLSENALEHIANRHLLWKEDLAQNIVGISRRIEEVISQKAAGAKVSGQDCMNHILTLQLDFLENLPERDMGAKSSQMYLDFLVCALEIMKRFNYISDVLQPKAASQPEVPSSEHTGAIPHGAVFHRS